MSSESKRSKKRPAKRESKSDHASDIASNDALDSRLSAFLRKAAPIIQSERGINARSRVLLESLAKDMKLPDELFQQGIDLLQDQSVTSRVEPTRWEQSFAKRLKHQLKDLKGGILTARMEAKAVAIAKEKYQLDEVQAREIIQQVAKELGVGRISISEAERHMEDLVQSKVGNAYWIDPSKRDLLYAEGKRWGLKSQHVESLIAHYVQINRNRHMRQKRMYRMLVGTMTIVIFVAAGGILLLVLQNNHFSRPISDSSETSSETGSESTEVKSAVPTWWTEPLQVGVVKAELSVRGFDAIVELLKRPDATARGTAYRQLVALLETRYPERDERARIHELITLFVLYEPSEGAMGAMLDALVVSATPPTDVLPSDVLFYDRSLGIVDLLARASENDALSTERRDSIKQELLDLTGTVVVNTYSASEVSDRFRRGHCESCYRALITSSATSPKQGLTRLEWLRPYGEGLLDPQKMLEFESQFLLVAIPYNDEEWDVFRSALQPCLVETNPILYRFITVAETTTNRELQGYLLNRISTALDVDIDRSNVEEAASQLRRQLGVVPGVEADALAIRVSRLRRRLDDLPDIQELAQAATPPFPQEIVSIMYHTSLAYALAQSPPASSYYDRVFQEGMPTVDVSRSDSDDDDEGPRRDPSQTDRDRFDRFIGRIARWDSQTTPTRIQTLKGLAGIADRFAEISPQDARSLAEYLLAEKEEREHLENLSSLPSFASWTNVILALADEMESATINNDWIEQILTSLLDRRLTLVDDDGLRREWRIQLLKEASDRLSSGAEVANSALDQRFANLQSIYIQQLHDRVQLIAQDSVRVQSEGASTAAAELLRQIRISSGGATSPADDAELASLTTIQYLTDEDLSRTVLIQRLIARAVAERLRQSNPEKRGQFDALMTEFESLDSQSKHLAVQLYLGEWDSTSTLDGVT